MRRRIEEIVKRLLTEPISRGKIDVMTDLAFPLPVYVIADMLGVPPEDRDQFHAWTQAVNLAFEAGLTPEQVSHCNRGARGLGDYLRALIAEHRKQPRDDLLSAMIEAEDNGQRLTEEELIGNAGMLLAAGFETTMGLIGNGVLALLQNPTELRRLQDDPSLVPNAVEEFLRYNSPVQYTGRWALEEFEFLGRTIRRGELVCLYVAAANRDSERFLNPDWLDVTRTDIEHLSFGGGRHYCLGAPLARLEAEVAFHALIPRLHDAELMTLSLEWRASSLNHALERLPVRFKSESSL
jgi:cytochrome P450